MEEYTEPLYHSVVRSERWNEDTIRAIIADSRYGQIDRKRLSSYYKNRHAPGETLVNYVFAEGCEALKIGRLYPRFGRGLQGFRRDIRNPILMQFYWDVDIENCHFNIARKLCIDYNISCPNLIRYCEHRDDVLEEISNDRTFAKVYMIRLLYGGEMQLYCPDYEDRAGEALNTSDVYIRELDRELRQLRLEIWDRYSDWQSLKIGPDKKKISTRANPKISLMALVLQTEERKMLMYLDHVLSKKHQRYMGVFCHDGGCVSKILGEDSFPPVILESCSRELTLFMGIPIRVTNKPITSEYLSPLLPPPRSLREEMIASFNRKYIYSMEKGQFGMILDDNSIKYMTLATMRINVANMSWFEFNSDKGKTERKFVLDEWMTMPDSTDYDSIGFIPYGAPHKPPGRVYNTFTGFQAERLEPDTPMEQEEIDERCGLIKYQVDMLTQGNSDYLFKWLSHIIQYPGIRIQASVLLRDIPGTLVRSGGTGKNMFIEWFGNMILGSRYFYVIGNNEQLFERFNTETANRLLIFVEEASGKANHAHRDALKAGITSTHTNREQKHQTAERVIEYSNIIFATNNRYTLPGDRRFAVFDCNPKHKGDVDYFKVLYNHLYDDRTAWAFFQFLKSYETYVDIMLFQERAPITEGYKDMLYASTDIATKFVAYLTQEGLLENKGVKSLYSDFCLFYTEKKKQSPDLPPHISIIDFSRSLFSMQTIGMKRPICVKHKTNKENMVRWDLDAVVSTLKRWMILDDDFVYRPQNPDQRPSMLFSANFNPPDEQAIERKRRRQQEEYDKENRNINL